MASLVFFAGNKVCQEQEKKHSRTPKISPMELQSMMGVSASVIRVLRVAVTPRPEISIDIPSTLLQLLETLSDSLPVLLRITEATAISRHP